MTWSHDRVLVDTMQRLDGLSIECFLLPESFDIDGPGDLAALGAMRDPAAMKQTLMVLERLGHGEPPNRGE